MSTPFLGEIKSFPFNFAPRGWALCNGQLLPINQNQALFSLLGTTYGGNGVQTFALPDLRGRTMLSTGSLAGGGAYTLGQTGGVESVALTTTQLPAHTHTVSAIPAAATTATPTGNLLATSQNAVYATTGTVSGMAAAEVPNAGSNGAHSNTQPSLVLNYCIALQGIFPSRN